MQWSLLRDLPEADAERVLATARRRRYGRGVVICHEGDPADTLHLVVSGRLAVRVTTPDGDNATLNILGRGDYFGELALVRTGATRRTATVLALEPAETLVLPASAFRDLCARDPRVEHVLVTALAARVEQLSTRLLETLYLGVDRRLYLRLLELASLYAADTADTAEPTAIPLTQDHLADLVGGTRPTVNQALQRLAEQGIVQLARGRITVVDQAALSRKAGRTRS
jgi:CRP/FNR family cyclic AMP-dependent transcriptional regulator